MRPSGTLYLIRAYICAPNNMRISLDWGPFADLSYKGAILYWGPKQGPQFRERPIRMGIQGRTKLDGVWVGGIPAPGALVASLRRKRAS